MDTAAADPRISAVLKQVSARRVEATIQKLVSFGTRSTLWAQDQGTERTRTYDSGVKPRRRALEESHWARGAPQCVLTSRPVYQCDLAPLTAVALISKCAPRTSWLTPIKARVGKCSWK